MKNKQQKKLDDIEINLAKQEIIKYLDSQNLKDNQQKKLTDNVKNLSQQEIIKLIDSQHYTIIEYCKKNALREYLIFKKK